MKNNAVNDVAAAIDKLAEQYATDKDGHFDLNAYTAFKAGFEQGFDVCMQVLKQSMNEDEH